MAMLADLEPDHTFDLDILSSLGLCLRDSVCSVVAQVAWRCMPSAERDAAAFLVFELFHKHLGHGITNEAPPNSTD
jgi:hypothetical protein